MSGESGGGTLPTMAADLAFAVGFGLFWALTRNVVGESLFVLPADASADARSHYVVSTVLLALLLLMVLPLREIPCGIAKTAASKPILATTALAGIAVLACTSCPLPAPATAAMQTIRDVAVAMALALLALAWAHAAASNFTRRTIVLLSLAFVINLAIGAIRPLGNEAASAVTYALALPVSACCWVVCTNSSTGIPQIDAIVGLRARTSSADAARRALPMGIVVMYVVFLLATTAARSVLLGNDLDDLFLGDFAWTAGMALFLCVVIVAVASSVQLTGRAVYLLWGVFSALLVGSVLLMIALRGSDAPLGNSLSLALCVNMYFLLFVTLVHGVGQGGIGLTSAMALFFSVKGLATLLSYMVMPTLTTGAALSGQGESFFSLAAAFMMVICLFAYVLAQLPAGPASADADETDVARAPATEASDPMTVTGVGLAGTTELAGVSAQEGPAIPPEQADPADDALPSPSHDLQASASQTELACSRLAHDYGLTERELDVLRLVPSGNNYRRIGELLYISQNTVLVHVKAIYKKTGVHTKQQLIDLIATYA